MGQWEGIVVYEDLPATAVEYCFGGQVRVEKGVNLLSFSVGGGWNGGGLSDRIWPDHEMVETNIGTIIVVFL